MSALCQCGRPTAGAVICAHCRHTTAIAIANVASYHDDLETVRTRQTRYTNTPGPRSSETPLGMDNRFGPGGTGTRALQATRTTATKWATQLLRDQPGLDRPMHDSVRATCRFFDRNLRDIVTRPWAAEFLADMLSCEKALARIIDRPAESWYAGVCGFELGRHDGTSCACACHVDIWPDDQEPTPTPAVCDLPGGCGRDVETVTCTRVLYATPGEPFVRCSDCGTTYDVTARRDQLLHEAEDRLATVEMITRIVTTLGDRDVRASKMSARIRQWAIRGRITSRGTRVVDGRLRPVYRIGDVLDLLARDETSASKIQRRDAS